MADEWRPPSVLSERTAARLSLTTLVALIGTVAVGGWVARERLAQVENKIERVEGQLADIPRRIELHDVERRISGTLRKQMRQAILRCPKRAVRGDAWMECQVIFPEE